MPALLWILERYDGVNGLHYLDDFLLFGSPNSSQCERALQAALACCRNLGVPVAPRKTKGPSTTLAFFGIELDTMSLTVCLPPPKLERLLREIQRWEGLKSCYKRELLSIIGQLQHACCVIKPGRSFLRRMIELSKGVRELHYRVRLNASFRSDLQWWGCFLPIWNGSCPLTSLCQGTAQVVLTSDASGSWGCGAFTSTGQWLQLQFPESWADIHITVKELLPIVLGAAVWGSKWKGLAVSCLCDNAAMVAIVNSGRSKMDRTMHLMRCLSFFLARWGVSMVCRHISGAQNGAADALSCGDVPSFQRLVPGADKAPTVIPDNLLQCLVLGTPDWTKVDWIALFGHSSLRAWPSPLNKVYSSGQRRYLSFCASAGLRAVPAVEEVLCKFAAKLASEGLKHRTIKSYMAGIRHLHIEEGLGDPFQPALPRLHYVLRGVKHSQGEEGTTSRERLPITPTLLHQIKAVWDHQESDPDYKMLWSACCLAFYSFLRAGEFTVPSDSGYDASTHLSWGDLAVDNLAQPSTLSIQLKASKTDPFRKGITLYIDKVPSNICPVAAMLAYLLVRDQQVGPLF